MAITGRTDILFVPRIQSGRMCCLGSFFRKSTQPPREPSIDVGASWVVIHPEKTAGDECSICLEGFSMHSRIRCLPCLHRYHEHCIQSWFSRIVSCPICQTKFDQCDGKDTTRLVGPSGR